jgi:hypothetical protein
MCPSEAVGVLRVHGVPCGRRCLDERAQEAGVVRDVVPGEGELRQHGAGRPVPPVGACDEVRADHGAVAALDPRRLVRHDIDYRAAEQQSAALADVRVQQVGHDVLLGIHIAGRVAAPRLIVHGDPLALGVYLAARVREALRAQPVGEAVPVEQLHGPPFQEPGP